MSDHRNYRILCLSEAVSPISHMSGTAGNEAIVAREPVWVPPHGVAWVPFLSGNALRHRLVREPGARWLIERYDLRGKLTLPQLNFLFHGGNLTEGGGREDTGRIASMQRIFPLIALLGGCLPDQILSGRLLIGRGTLVCRETSSILASILPPNWNLPDRPLHSAEQFVGSYQYTRGDSKEECASWLADDSAGGQAEAKPAQSNRMIFGGQAVMAGACFLHDFLLRNSSLLELGALLWSLRLWQQAGGTIGGQSSRGHGKLATAIHCEADGDEAIDAYLAHADSVRDEAIAWLDSGFAPRAEKPKAKKAKEAKA